MTLTFIRAKGAARKDVYEGAASTDSVISGAAGASTDLSCMKSIKTALFSKSSDANTCAKVAAAGPYSFDCVYQPDFFANSVNILVFENFYYTSSALGIKPLSDVDSTTAAVQFPLITTAKNIADAADTVCNKNWKDVNDNYPKVRECYSIIHTLSFEIFNI